MSQCFKFSARTLVSICGVGRPFNFLHKNVVGSSYGLLVVWNKKSTKVLDFAMGESFISILC